MDSATNIIVFFISTYTARCFVFNQTTFKRHIAPTGDSSSTSPPMFDNSPLPWADCFQECHYAPGCQSVVIEGENCRLYTDTGNHGNDSFNVVSSLSYSNLNDFTTSKCTANGYLYDDFFSICYKPETTLANDTYARQLCQQSGGRLMVIDSPQKQNFIGNITLPTGPGVTNFRIDAFLSGGIWRFADQREITTFYWGDGEPTHGYPTVCISLTTYRWNDVHVNYNHAVLCEKVL
ncbi:hepatic lectin-like [Magallana gigas]|uniref:hepatic lectin-like n=1 Tax=Magallana gigas TaxID=29159 RepID=UPI00334292FF